MWCGTLRAWRHVERPLPRHHAVGGAAAGLAAGALRGLRCLGMGAGSGSRFCGSYGLARRGLRDLRRSTRGRGQGRGAPGILPPGRRQLGLRSTPRRAASAVPGSVAPLGRGERPATPHAASEESVLARQVFVLALWHGLGSLLRRTRAREAQPHLAALADAPAVRVYACSPAHGGAMRRLERRARGRVQLCQCTATWASKCTLCPSISKVELLM